MAGVTPALRMGRMQARCARAGAVPEILHLPPDRTSYNTLKTKILLKPIP
jgi:hypothetical protein